MNFDLEVVAKSPTITTPKESREKDDKKPIISHV